MRDKLLELLRVEAGFDIDYYKIGFAKKTDNELIIMILSDIYEKIESAKDHSHSIY